MKLKLKMIAVAAALASLAGVAQAQIVTETTNNGTLVLTVFNQANKAWYMRNLGFTLNTFLPSGVLASVGDPSSALVGNKNPDAGLVLNASNTANFGDAAFSTWFAGQSVADLRWNVTAVDSRTCGTPSQGRQRIIVSSANLSETAANGQISNFVNTSNAGSAQAYFGNSTLSSSNLTGSSPYQTSLDDNFGLGGDGLATIGQKVGLFYFARTTNTGSTSVLAPANSFSNKFGAATVSLASNGNFTYTSPVPMPPALWLMGAGLVAIGGMVRRRKAAAVA